MKNFTLHMDYYELVSLHKALLETKFNEHPNNELVSGSPLVADIYIQVRDFLIQSNKQWEAWFQLKNRPNYKKSVMMRMQKNESWKNASDEEKKKIAEDYLAPFLYDEAELSEVVAEVECAFKEQNTTVWEIRRMAAEDFVKLCFNEKEAILKEYFAANSQTQVAKRINELIQNGANKDAVYDLISLVLNENYYNLLLGLDGETSLGSRQISYKIFDEDNTLLNGCGEIEEAAFRYFMEG